jgi:hypothetical protein
MDTLNDLGGWRGHALAVEIKLILLAVRCPGFFQSVCLLGGGDPESIKRQDHGAYTNMRLSAFADMPALRTPKNGGTNVSLGSNSLKHTVQFVAQLDDSVEGHAPRPLGAQPLDHFLKPHSLSVTCGHA